MQSKNAAKNIVAQEKKKGQLFAFRLTANVVNHGQH